MRSLRSRRCRGIGTALLVLACFDASAAVYKCVDATGKQTYQQQPCPSSATGSKLKTGEDWTQVKGKIFFEPEPKQVGSYKRFVFRMKDENFRSEPVNIEGYVYYDCGLSSIGGPHLRTDFAGRKTPVDLATIENNLLSRTGVTSFQTYRQGGGNALLPLADKEFVDFACGTPVANAGGPRPSGPEAAIHAAKPEGMTVDDISFGEHGWVKIRGTTLSEEAIGTFMRNLELTPEFQHASYSGLAGDGSFQVSVQQERGARQ